MIAQKEDVLVIGRVADWTGSGFLLFLGVLVQPRQRVELGDLLLVFDFVFVQKGAWTGSHKSVYERTASDWNKETYPQSCRRPRQGGMPGGKWGNYLPFRTMLSGSCRARCDHRSG